jgi:hypothetical protein
MSNVNDGREIPPDTHNLGQCTWCAEPATRELIISKPGAKKRQVAPVCLICARRFMETTDAVTVDENEERKLAAKKKAAQRRAYVVY